MKSNKSISIVIPCFNEEKIILESLNKLVKYLKNNVVDYEIIIIDDGSIDKTFEKINSCIDNYLNIRYYKLNKNYGKGYAIRYGIIKSTKSIIFFIDADITYDLKSINEMIDIYKNFDVAMICGSRHIKGNETYKNFPLHRRLTGKIFSIIIQLTLFNDIKDSQCGFKSIKSEIAKKIAKDLKINDFGFDLEVLFYVKKILKLNIFFIPVYPLYIRVESKVNIFFDSLKMLLDILLIRFRFFNQKKIYD
jgi:dolichyl-phosphate beta-glucosyltransferase